MLASEIARRIDRGDSFALAVLDLNRFKEVNDTFGHEYGDRVLVETARRLVTSVREDDVVARLGGDEFAVVLNEAVDGPADRRFVERVTAATAEPIDLGETTIVCTPSIGVARSRPDEVVDVSTLLHWADVAMYEAKASNLGSCVFSPASEQRLNLIRIRRAALSAGIENDEFVLRFQPKVDMLDGRIYGVEGLARWEHPEDGLLPPEDFIDIVSSSSQMKAFTDRVVDEGARFAAACNAQGTPISVAINIAARSLLDLELASRAEAIARRHGIDPSQLTFEITEQDIMDDGAVVNSVLNDLVELGISLSVDDFGTGYSSLTRLLELPVREVKIDRRFVEAAPRSDQHRVAVRSIVDLAGNLGLDVVAEGVEKPAEGHLLVSFGCRRAQGFLFGSPERPEQVLQTLAAGRVPVLAPVEVAGHDRFVAR